MDATKRISKTLGGDRLGSGNKMNVDMHAYSRSTHDLSFAWRSSMNVGTLVPFLHKVGLPGDTWSINMETLVRTIPTIGPLYGSYKLQLDVFKCPIRLYNGLLHNNMLKVGLNMSQVKLPKIKLKHRVYNPNLYENRDVKQIANDSLLAYLGIRGIGDVNFRLNTTDNYVDVERTFNAVPILAYWDIVKNYYINKQETYCHYVTCKPNAQSNYIERLEGRNRITISAEAEWITNFVEPNSSPAPTGVTLTGDTYQEKDTSPFTFKPGILYFMKAHGELGLSDLEFVVRNQNTMAYSAVPIATIFPNYDTNTEEGEDISLGQCANTYWDYEFIGIGYRATTLYTSGITIHTFPAEDLDDTRIAILRDTGLNNELDISTLTASPFKAMTSLDGGGQNYNKYTQQGLALKTHQSDLLNNWLKTEWLDGATGINNITRVDTSSGSFEIDALNLATKVYNMLNRIATGGGSSEDYYEAVYSVEVARRPETPMYMGGLSCEVVFEEVVSQSATNEQPLGSLAGRGTIANKRGGHLEIYIENEPCYIIGIASLTPRIDYSTGNSWDMTELDNIDDLHKPALDGIGFEDLLQERGAWWGTWWSTADQSWHKEALGKTPAWINYMTSINETFGDFADPAKCMYMTLNRQYEMYDQTDVSSREMGIKDATTYINPTKYNYAFADTNLEAQNFWVQIGMGIECRRVMSAKVIPYL